MFQDLGDLFDKLDADNDGRVSYDEFVNGLFEHGNPPTPSRPQSSLGKKLRLASAMNMDW